MSVSLGFSSSSFAADGFEGWRIAITSAWWMENHVELNSTSQLPVLNTMATNLAALPNVVAIETGTSSLDARAVAWGSSTERSLGLRAKVPDRPAAFRARHNLAAADDLPTIPAS